MIQARLRVWTAGGTTRIDTGGFPKLATNLVLDRAAIQRDKIVCFRSARSAVSRIERRDPAGWSAVGIVPLKERVRSCIAPAGWRDSTLPWIAGIGVQVGPCDKWALRRSGARPGLPRPHFGRSPRPAGCRLLPEYTDHSIGLSLRGIVFRT